MHLRAYDAYRKRHGKQQALIEGRCRGGFGTCELDEFIPGWREEISVLNQLKAEVTKLRKAINAHLDEFAWMEGPEGWRESVQALRDALSENESS